MTDHLSPLPALIKDNPAALNAITALQKDYALDKQKLDAILDRFLWEFNKGLTEQHNPLTKDTFLPMIPTFVQDVPNGSEVGDYLALDLGGTNLRCALVKLLGNKQFKVFQQKYTVSDQLKTGHSRDLFDYIAESIRDFVSKQDIKTDEDNYIHMGFTFSFPVQQTALNSGTLLTWTKGFEATHAVGEDVVQLLQSSLDRKNINVRVSALVNDTVGTLLSRAYQSGDALVGAIFGTGTNGAYVENVDQIKCLTKESKYPTMIINTEWGAFDNERVVLPITAADNKLDRESINPRKQAFEKMISGMYLGEIVRNVLLQLVDSLVLFKGHSTAALNRHYGFDTALMSAIEAPSLDNLAETISAIRQVLVQELAFRPEQISDLDCLIVRRVSEIVGTRGARLSACAVAAVAKQTGNHHPNQSQISVGIDGSLAEFYPGFEERLRLALVDLLGADVEKNVKIGLAKDGSGVGAALCALQAKKQQVQGKEQ